MLIGALVLAVVVGLLAGGKLKNLSYLPLRGAWLVLGALFLQAVLSWTAAKGLGIGPRWVGPLLHILSYVLLLAFTWVNRSLPGVRVLAAGVFLNGLVIAVNGGLMPVAPGVLPPWDIARLAKGVGIHGLMSARTRLTFLSDRFYLAAPVLGRQLFSVGDVLIDVGAFWLVFRSLRAFSGTEEKGVSG
ncbi:hypothetical protein CEB3_c44280 [Peptococcaceae bacterium CEB3]|nr:hypothetical protein CEB3_c44280 [Peptococcaceae bacterium CEB3]